MRKLLIPLLLASAIAPAAASAEDGGLARGLRAQAERSDRDRSENRSQRASRPQRSERADRPARVERIERPARIERAERPARVERIERSYRDRRVDRRIESPAVQVEPVREVRTIERVQRVNRRDRDARSLADGFRAAARDGVRDRRDYDRDRDGWRDRDRNYRRWSSDWRRDRRYDWSSYRNRYGSLFRLGRYHDPYGYGYRRFSIGFSLWPSYYGSSFWLDDPWQYRLPPAYGPYRWVRYYDDALLVDIYSGQVVDVIHNVFW